MIERFNVGKEETTKELDGFMLGQRVTLENVIVSGSGSVTHIIEILDPSKRTAWVRPEDNEDAEPFEVSIDKLN